VSQLRVSCFAISIDGYGAGPHQDRQNPLGVGGEELHNWYVPTRTFQSMRAVPKEGTTGIDDDFAKRGIENIGAWILGRNMFGPVRGPWPDDAWKGWWGNNPLRRAKEAAGGKDVRLGGGAATIRQYLSAKLVDEMHFAISPLLLGSGESLLAGLDLVALGYRVSEQVASEGATHVVITRGTQA